MLAEAEQRVADVVKSAQNMVRTMYAELDGGTIEVDVRVVLEGLVVDEDDDGDKSVSGKDHHVYRFCFVVELPPHPTTLEPASQPVAPMGLLSPADIVTSSVAGSVQYWPPIDFTLQSPDLATPQANSAYLPAHSVLAPQGSVCGGRPNGKEAASQRGGSCYIGMAEHAMEGGYPGYVGWVDEM
ncbi:hypothetical protein FRC11_001983 [Ceratobasidium sp. 423]|nr:hypothetical protein FRC11_001983 [Ceratobasidium sp. 423]